MATGGGNGSLSAHELDAPSLANFFGFAQQDASYLPGPAYMRTAASREVEVVNVDQPQLVLLDWRYLAQA